MTKNARSLSLLIGLLAACGGSSAEPVALAPGFSAPMILEGRAGGTTDASSLGDGCIGNIGSDPDHVFELSAAIPNLRFYAHASEDITLVIQRPDNSYICNDDTEELNPVVTMDSFPPGTYKVWVGSYAAEGSFAAYKLGLSTDASAMPSSLAN
ncbi:MAG: hypothetical protein AAF411_01490 [Myxococcota bacterium]